MGTFMQTFERVAVKYAEYVEAKLTFSAKVKRVKETRPGQQVIFLEQEEEAEKFTKEMQVLNQMAQMLKEKPGENVIELNSEELEDLQVTEAELEEFNRKTVCFVERNGETGAVEITPGNGRKIILNDTGQIKAFLQIAGSYLKEGGTEDGRDKRMETMLAQTSREEVEEIRDVRKQKGSEKVEATKVKNDKQAAEYIRRLANEELPEMKVEVNYFESKIAQSDESEG